MEYFGWVLLESGFLGLIFWGLGLCLDVGGV